MTKEEFSKIDKFGVGEPNEAFAKYFIGQSFLKPLTDTKKGEFPIFNTKRNPQALPVVRQCVLHGQ